MSQLTLRSGSPDKTRADVVVVGVLQGATGPDIADGGEAVLAAFGRRSAALLSGLGVAGRAGEAIRIPSNGAVAASMVLFVGMGPATTPDGVRRAAGVAARSLGNAASVSLALPASDLDLLRAVVEGYCSGGYTFGGKPGPAAVALLSPLGRSADAKAVVEQSQAVAERANLARDWVNTAPNLLPPAILAEEIQSAARSAGVECTVWDENDLARENCGGVLAIGLGSQAPPRVVRLDYSPADAVEHVALVGKGITFDSGGYTIKPASSMRTMKSDMAGAAAAAAATLAAADLGLPIRITTFLPLAENMISGAAVRPGDVVTTRSGQTVEITNTDAEGRMVLADALTLAVETEPSAILNVATLTGPCVVALGDRIGGVFGDDQPVGQVLGAAAAAGEPMWRLPIPDQMTAAVRDSKIADLLQHNWVRWGSASYAAAFLQAFTGSIPFVHLDIAGPGFNAGAAYGEVPTGGTGFATRTIVQWLGVIGMPHMGAQ